MAMHLMSSVGLVCVPRFGGFLGLEGDDGYMRTGQKFDVATRNRVVLFDAQASKVFFLTSVVDKPTLRHSVFASFVLWLREIFLRW